MRFAAIHLTLSYLDLNLQSQSSSKNIEFLAIVQKQPVLLMQMLLSGHCNSRHVPDAVDIPSQKVRKLSEVQKNNLISKQRTQVVVLETYPLIFSH